MGESATRPPFTVCRSFLDGLRVPGLLLRHDGTVAHGNQAFASICASAADDGAPWAWLHCVEGSGKVRATLERSLAEDETYEIELITHDGDDRRHICICAASPYVGADGAPHGLLLVLWDVTRRREEEERLAFAAEHDMLTGLGNRRSLDASLRHAAGRAARGDVAALLLMDLDHLKAVNDRFGHAAGDRALVGFAELLVHEFRPSEQISRVGGDEFAVVVEDVDFEQACAIAERARARAETGDFAPGGADLGIGMSCGVAAVVPGISPDEALARADEALYEAKSEGGDRVVLWSEDVRSSGRSARSLFESIFETEGGLVLAFQPIVSARSHRIEGFECLARVRVDEGGVVDAREFVPALERRGRTGELLLRVLDLVVDASVKYPEYSFAMNMSPADVGSPELLDRVAQRLEDEDRLIARNLTFELSADEFFGQRPQADRWLDRLGRLGHRFVLDGLGEWGDGRALHRAGLTGAKTGRSLAQLLVGSEEERDFLAAYRRLIGSYVPSVVADKVESREQLDAALRAGFTHVQGRAVCPPVLDVEEASPLVVASMPMHGVGGIIAT